MSEADKLKIEARELLEEVNNILGKQTRASVYNSDSLFEYSFKNRLEELRQKVISLNLASSLNRQ